MNALLIPLAVGAALLVWGLFCLWLVFWLLDDESTQQTIADMPPYDGLEHLR